jgi:hypothetical protein
MHRCGTIVKVYGFQLLSKQSTVALYHFDYPWYREDGLLREAAQSWAES